LSGSDFDSLDDVDESFQKQAVLDHLAASMAVVAARLASESTTTAKTRSGRFSRTTSNSAAGSYRPMAKGFTTAIA
jgi:hypothetical protein